MRDGFDAASIEGDAEASSRVVGGLDGKIAIVTGAGQGLGRAEARELAAAGARVVVNDVGAGLRGGNGTNHAAEVVDEIVSEGGVAIAHHGDVADFDDARQLIETAVDTWGTLDIVVNNAGNLRERMIFNMSAQEWDDVIRVHLRGHFATSRWAARYWRDAAKAAGSPVYGRVINTSSEAFLNGAVGQPNYAAAKAGIVQLTLNLSQALARFGVTANAICPRALTRMTESSKTFQGDVEGHFAPENVSPLVAWLSSPASERVSGQVFIIYGSTIQLLAPPTVAQRFTSSDRWSVDGVDGVLRPYFADRDPDENFVAALHVIRSSESTL